MQTMTHVTARRSRKKLAIEHLVQQRLQQLQRRLFSFLSIDLGQGGHPVARLVAQEFEKEFAFVIHILAAHRVQVRLKTKKTAWQKMIFLRFN